MKKIVVIDGKSVFYRGYYAMGALSLSDGTPTGGVYGFAAIAMELIKRLNPDKVVVAWDKAGTSTAQRSVIYSEYKAGRKKPPEDFFAQIPLLRELIEALGWYFCEIDNYEADDIIGTLAYQVMHSDAPGDEYEMVIISSDLDMLQVVGERVKMYRLLKGFTELEEMDIPAVEAKYGIRKEQFLDLKALKGDASDNIPGVPGIGEKGAVKLLNQFGTLEGVYEHIDEIKGATQKKLVEGRESAFMSKKLATIFTDAPVELSEIPEVRTDEERIRAELEKLEFRSLIRKFFNSKKPAITANDSLSEARSSLPSSRDSAANTRQQPPYPPTKEHSPRGLENIYISFDVKKDLHANEELATEILRGKEFYDLGQGRFLLNPLERKTLSNSSVGGNYDTGHSSASTDALLVHRTLSTAHSVTPVSLNNTSSRNLYEEYQKQQTEFEDKRELRKVLYELDLPMIPVLYKIEKKGMKIDREYFSRLSEEYSEEVEILEEEVKALSGVDFNVNSPIQLSEVLFSKLGLSTKGIKKTTRGYSTGAKELEKLRDEHPVIDKIKEYREAAKLLSTYILPLPSLADETGRIHTTFTQDVTATGRLSSLSPNLQNIPTRTEAGKRIREGFVVDEGKVLVSLDYAQFELRLAAALANDTELIKDFNEGVDIHTKTAADVFGVEMNEVTKEQRRAAKVVNFGIIYGMSAKGLSEAAGMSFYQAKEFIEKYMAVRRAISEKMKEWLEEARTKGYVQTLFGRRRPTPDVKSSNFVVRSGAERAAQNMPIQGTEADLVKRAMIEIDRRLPEGAEMVMQVHDSVMLEVDEKKAENTSRVVKEIMENICPELSVKLAVDVKIGKNWGEV